MAGKLKLHAYSILGGWTVGRMRENNIEQLVSFLWFYLTWLILSKCLTLGAMTVKNHWWTTLEIKFQWRNLQKFTIIWFSEGSIVMLSPLKNKRQASPTSLQPFSSQYKLACIYRVGSYFRLIIMLSFCRIFNKNIIG